MKNANIVDALEAEIGIDGEARNLTDAVTAALCQGGYDEIDAVGLAATRRSAIVKIIDDRQRSAQADGLVHTLEVVGAFRSHVGGAGRPEVADDDKLSLAKQGRRQIASILACMKALDHNQFELFGAALIRSLGASVSEKTRQTGDQGIDFVGTTRLGELLSHPKNIFKLAHDMQIDFIGQAKHYPNRPLNPSTVRELVGSLELARSRHFSNDDFCLLEDLSLKSFSPVFALLISTGPVTEGARSVAEKSGIIIRSGDQIATYLADLGVGIVPETGGFSKAVFKDWMLQSIH